jgi:hypothetical protein
MPSTNTSGGSHRKTQAQDGSVLLDIKESTKPDPDRLNKGEWRIISGSHHTVRGIFAARIFVEI